MRNFSEMLLRARQAPEFSHAKTHSRHHCIAANSTNPRGHSITASAREQHRRDFEAERLGCLEIDTHSYLVGACTGKSAGLSPLSSRPRRIGTPINFTCYRPTCLARAGLEDIFMLHKVKIATAVAA